MPLGALASPLVAGEPQEGATIMATIRVCPFGLDGQAGFFYGGKPHYPGAVLEVPDRFAREMVAQKKAEFWTAPAEAAASPEPVKLKGELHVKQRSVGS